VGMGVSWFSTEGFRWTEYNDREPIYLIYFIVKPNKYRDQKAGSRPY
jgi:hypothetical protein